MLFVSLPHCTEYEQAMGRGKIGEDCFHTAMPKQHCYKKTGKKLGKRHLVSTFFNTFLLHWRGAEGIECLFFPSITFHPGSTPAILWWHFAPFSPLSPNITLLWRGIQGLLWNFTGPNLARFPTDRKPMEGIQFVFSILVFFRGRYRFAQVHSVVLKCCKD